MGYLTAEQRAEYASRAAEVYENSTAKWIKSAWIKDLDTGRKIGANRSIGAIRNFLKERGLLRGNKQCGVCAEGAIILALAQDDNVPDDWMADSLLVEFRPEARRSAVYNGWYDDPDQVRGIPDMNDTFFQGEEDAVRLLRRMGEN